MSNLATRLRRGADYHESTGDIGLPCIMRQSADTIDALCEAMETIDRHVGHGLIGDWSIALAEIRKGARAAVAKARGEQP